MSVIFLFIDGVGIGQKNAEINPFAAVETPALDRLFKLGKFFLADATLGVQGLPQSATGQTAIFTGVNAPKVLGKHLSGRPTESLKNIIETDNIFKELIKRGYKVDYANVYRDEYIENIGEMKNKRERPSVTTVMSLSADIPLKNVEGYRKGLGVYHDITGDILQKDGYDVDILSAQEAAKRLVRISRNSDFTLYEHFISDIIGHKGSMEEAVNEVKLLNEFIDALLKEIDPERDLLILASDHGNLEDKSVKTHTMNKVPVIFYGNMAEDIDIKVDSLVDIMPAVLKIMDRKL